MSLNLVILAAGQGTRMRSTSPKVMHYLGGKPLLEHVLATAKSFPENNTIVVIGHGKDEIQAHFKESSLTWVVQEEQLGTGHAVLQTLSHIGEEDRVLILYGDVPLMRRETLQHLLNAAGPDELGFITAILKDPTGFGRVIRNQQDKVIAVVEHKDATPQQLQIKEINTGIMVVPAKRLKEWLPRLEAHNAQREYYLTDIIQLAVKTHCPIVAVTASDTQEVLGVNDRLQLIELERVYQKKQAEKLILQGVQILDPARFDLRGKLQVGQDTVFDINVIISGHVEIGDRCTIGPNVLLKNVAIGDDTTILANSVLEEANVGSECIVGPFARIRPGTRLANKAHVGNFVELKQSLVGEGSKINHLSYVGDTIVGAKVNVGAGAITCNYDGAYKHRTVIEDEAFIGSNSSLVAPVTIGKNATIGAGTVLTEDAEANALTVGRTKQKTVKGWQRPQKGD